MTASPRPPVAVAFVPSTPLLVPEVAGRAAEDTADLRAACVAAVAAALAGDPDVVVVVGGADPDGPQDGAGNAGTLRGFGVDRAVPFGGTVRSDGGRPSLALSLGAWLLDAAGWTGDRLGVGPDGLAGALADRTASVAVLAVADGSARRTLKAPGYLDEDAEPFDAAVASALARGDAAGLAALDAEAGERLLAAGTATWRAVGAALAGRPARARLHYDAAPHGVGYVVADWQLP